MLQAAGGCKLALVNIFNIFGARLIRKRFSYSNSSKSVLYLRNEGRLRVCYGRMAGGVETGIGREAR